MAGHNLRRHFRPATRVEKNGIDRVVLIMITVFTALGILAVTDASAPQALATFGNPYYFAKQQIIWAVIGYLGLIVATHIDYHYWKRLAPVIVGITIFLLLAVVLPGVGSRVLGARRWISIGPATLQPSEIAKFGIALAIAYLVDEKKPWHIIAAPIGVMAALIMLQPDLGTTIVIVAIGLAQLFIGGIPIVYLLGLSSFAGVLAGLLVLFSEYRRQRVLTFLESSSDPLGTSYHMRQILIALGSGGLFGVGIGQSRQKHLFLPETATDSVFAVIAEEIGYLGSAVLVVALAYFVLRLYKISRSAPDDFGKVLGVGISTWIGGQMFLNLSSMVAITPLTGIPLPFFSYGGSSLVMILFALGILLNISKYRSEETK